MELIFQDELQGASSLRLKKFKNFVFKLTTRLRKWELNKDCSILMNNFVFIKQQIVLNYFISGFGIICVYTLGKFYHLLFGKPILTDILIKFPLLIFD